MKIKFICATVIIIFAVGILAACTQTTPTPTEETRVEETEAVEEETEDMETEEMEASEKSEAEILIDERCSQCHSASKVYAESYSEEEWVEVFDHMIEKGANVTEEEKSLMIDWLVNRP